MAAPRESKRTTFMADEVEASFHEMQLNVASRSKYGELRKARSAGHDIPQQQPAIVVQAIKDVLNESKSLRSDGAR